MHPLRHYFGLHRKNAVEAFGELLQKPVATALTITVIGIALALPAALNLLVKNGQGIADSFEGVRDFSVYMKPGVDIDVAEKLAGKLKAKGTIASVRLISADDALAELQEVSGFESALGALNTNPLPHTLVVSPTEMATTFQLQDLGRELQNQPGVDQVRIDTEWVERLNAILDLLNRSVSIAGLMLIAAVIIIIGNTIRLDIQSRRDEIEVLKLLGASDGFVRRPFLYEGIWYGLLGGGFGMLIIILSAGILAEPLETLTGLYQSNFALQGFDPATIGAMLGGGVLAGWGGAWTAVSRHISAIQPT